jgi:hypothetical protein
MLGRAEMTIFISRLPGSLPPLLKTFFFGLQNPQAVADSSSDAEYCEMLRLGMGKGLFFFFTGRANERASTFMLVYEIS